MLPLPSSYNIQMADDNADLHAVLTIVGITEENIRTQIIENEGFTSIQDFLVMDADKDVESMANRMGRRPAASQVSLSTVSIKRLQAYIWWLRDRNKCGQPITAAAFTAEELTNALQQKTYRKELAEGVAPSIKELAKFDPDTFEQAEDAFENFLSRNFGVNKEPLSYVICSDTAPTEFESTEQERMYQLPLTGPAFELDNKTTYKHLKAFLTETEGCVWIEPYKASENGRAAYQAWTNHYNGQGELNKLTKKAKALLDSLFYKNERALPFETVSQKMNKCFQVLQKDPDQQLSQRQQVEYLQKALQPEDTQLKAAIPIISSQHANNFVAACAFFSSEVSRIHGEAQNAYQGRKRRVSVLHGDSGRGSRGRGQFGHGG